LKEGKIKDGSFAQRFDANTAGKLVCRSAERLRRTTTIRLAGNKDNKARNPAVSLPQPHRRRKMNCK